MRAPFKIDKPTNSRRLAWREATDQRAEKDYTAAGTRIKQWIVPQERATSITDTATRYAAGEGLICATDRGKQQAPENAAVRWTTPPRIKD
jgi:hypothetical protein